MKKLLCLILIFALSVSLCSCDIINRIFTAYDSNHCRNDKQEADKNDTELEQNNKQESGKNDTDPESGEETSTENKDNEQAEYSDDLQG